MRLHWIAALALAALATVATVATSSQAHAIGRLADVSVIDRNTGATLPTYYHRGEYWVAGLPGAKYAISVRNRTGERVLAVAAVDGVNVLSGDTASWEQTGYVFGPSQSYQITGWRKSNAEVAAFEFTASPNSYAERTGRPANVGVIGVAVFRERQVAPAPFPVPVPMPLPAPMSRFGDAARGAANESAGSLSAPSAPAADAATLERRSEAAAAPKLGTGHGQRETSYVTQAEFARLQSQPNEVIRIRYDSRENLVSMGIIRNTYPQPPVPNPFPESAAARYAPDPPAYR